MDYNRVALFVRVIKAGSFTGAAATVVKVSVLELTGIIS